MRLALLATLLTFAGSIAGFHLTSAAGAPGREALAEPPARGEAQVVRVTDECAARRLWEEA